jgi:two-component system cell cycle sensor histidine kinase/response regulator CckA
MRLIFGEKIELAVVLDSEQAHILADIGQIEMVLMNLVLNARDAMPRGGRFELRTAMVGLDSPDESQPHVRITVSDTGSGMDAVTQERLFEPFFTKGVGQGLAVVRQTVEQYRGRLEVSSEPGMGATFSIYFPVMASYVAESKPLVRQDPTKVAGGVETVLLAEDDDGVRSMVHDFLERQGYVVLEARTGREVLDICEQHEGPIHLLLSDVVIPDGDGPDLAHQVALFHPEIRILYISGYAEPAIASRGDGSRRVQFLAKPFTIEALAEKVRATLNDWI